MNKEERAELLISASEDVQGYIQTAKLVDVASLSEQALSDANLIIKIATMIQASVEKKVEAT